MQCQAKATSSDDSILQKRYETAQKLQAAHDLNGSAQQYRIFLADALGQIAVSRAHAGEYDKAASDFDEALRLVPDFPLLQLEYARAALAGGNLQRAKLLASGVLRNHPENTRFAGAAHALLGRVLLKQDKDAEARQEIEKAVALDPTFENGYELAIADLDLGDQKSAAKIFSEMLASFGDTAEIHLYFGQAYGSSDFQSDSVQEFKKAIAKDPKLPGVHYSLAAAYLATSGSSRLPEAEAELRKEIALSAKDAPAYAALGHLLAGQAANPAKAFEAENDLKRATQLDPKSPDAFLYLGQFYAAANRPAEAEAALRQSIALTSDPSRNAFQVQKAHYLLGRLLLQSGHPEDGKQEIAASQALQQQNLARDQNRLADYLQENKHAPERKAQPDGMAPRMPLAVEDRQDRQDKPVDAEGARQMDLFEKKIAPAIADSYNNLGAIAGTQGDFRAAALAFSRAAEWNPSLPGLDFNWGRAAFAAGQVAQAIGPLSRFLQQHPDDDGARTVLGLSQFMTKDFVAARGTLQPLDGKPGQAAQVRFAYAESLLRTGATPDALAHLQALEKSDPTLAQSLRQDLAEASRHTPHN